MTPTRPAPFHVELLLHERFLLGSAFTVVDMLRAANTIDQLRHGEDGPPAFTWQLLGPDARPWATNEPMWRLYAGSDAPDPPVAAPAGSTGAAAARRALLVPHLHTRNVPMVRTVSARLTDWVEHIARAIDTGEVVMTLGNGVWCTARTGRLSGRQLTLPWMYLGGFTKDFPDIHIVADAPLVQDGRLWSATHVDSLPELVLRLIALGAGDDLARSCRSAFCFEPDRQATTAQAARADRLAATRDSTLARAIDWMNTHLERPYCLAEVAEAAAVSPRTLLRHFEQVLGHSPLDHLHLLRCRRARVLLEITLDSIPAVAEACGYADPAAFRRVFLRHVGETPSRYRERFALRSARSRWQVEARREV